MEISLVLLIIGKINILLLLRRDIYYILNINLCNIICSNKVSMIELITRNIVCLKLYNFHLLSAKRLRFSCNSVELKLLREMPLRLS